MFQTVQHRTKGSWSSHRTHPRIDKATFDVWIDRGEVIQHELSREKAFSLNLWCKTRCRSCFRQSNTVPKVVGAPTVHTQGLTKRHLMCGSTAAKLFSMNSPEKRHFSLILGCKTRCRSCFRQSQHRTKGSWSSHSAHPRIDKATFDVWIDRE